MQKVSVIIENCYGINSFEGQFDFTGQQSTHIIYAPNGVMKTSFANVFDDYSKDSESKDLIFKNRVSNRKITDINGKDVERESIFVIRPLESSYKSDKMSTLLVREELRKKYAEIHEKIDIEKDKLIKELKKASGIRNSIEEEISASFNGENLLNVLEQLSTTILNGIPFLYNEIVYKKIFDEKVLAFLETGDFRRQIQKYIEKYNELVSNSTFLKKEFNHYHAATVHKNLNENGFFKAEHTINLKVNGTKTEIHTEKDLIKMINEEKEKILKDDALKKDI